MQKVAKKFFLISFMVAFFLTSMFLFGIRSLAKKLTPALSYEILGYVSWLEFLGSVLLTALIAWQLGKYFRTTVREDMIKMVELVWCLCGVIGAIMLCLIHTPVGVGVLTSLTYLMVVHWYNELIALRTSVPDTARKLMDNFMTVGKDVKGSSTVTNVCFHTENGTEATYENPADTTEIEISSVPTHMQ